MSIALSWSRLSTFQQCPRKFYLQFLEKAFPQEEKSFHLIKGENLHKQLENYVVARNTGQQIYESFSPPVEQTLPLVDNILSNFQEVLPEAQIAVTYDFKPTGWFDKDVAWRAIFDLQAKNPDQLFIVDWKSGKFYDYTDDKGQLHLSALIGHHLYETVNIDVAYVYIEQKKTSKIKFHTKEEFDELRAHFQQQYEIVNAEKDFKPTINDNCKWCPATKAQCQFSRKLK